MRIIVTGLVAQYPFGGVAWDYLQFVEGFRQLGHEVLYLEDTGMWPYDPVNHTVSADCSYNVRYLDELMNKFGLAGRWSYRNAADGSVHGAALDLSADLFFNVSGCGVLRDEYRKIPKKIFLDTDPMFTQIAPREEMREYDHHFTFAENIAGHDCRIPTLDIEWNTTRQPIVLDWWQPVEGRASSRPSPTPVGHDGAWPSQPRDVFTTVMNWVSYKPVEYEGETWGQKDVEFLKFVDLPARTTQKFEIAMGMGPGRKRPTDLLREKGWAIVEPSEHLPDPWTYRDYLAQSKGEWSVAKEGYVKSRSGWFSCRSACYLALGKPCVLQDTGWSRVVPTGDGLFAFDTLDEAVAGIEELNADYAHHCREARAIAEEFFDARKVLGQLLENLA